MFKYSAYTTAALLTGSLLIPTTVHAFELEERVFPITSIFNELSPTISFSVGEAIPLSTEELDIMGLSSFAFPIVYSDFDVILPPLGYKIYTPYHYITEGQTANVFLTWYPPFCNMEVGLWDGVFHGVQCTSSPCSESGVVSPTGFYYFYVKSLCNVQTEYDLYYWFNN